ncbi:vWA domain-containing protein [Bernardetia sp.]|uniref:vWA domain-containing protein n=1 Tax=Bernardetia sp. TaxID=1937974 RepID=UPI0025BFC6FD|nr:VWA domain-containing protein [Bernardetia sp.]
MKKRLSKIYFKAIFFLLFVVVFSACSKQKQVSNNNVVADSTSIAISDENEIIDVPLTNILPPQEIIEVESDIELDENVEVKIEDIEIEMDYIVTDVEAIEAPVEEAQEEVEQVFCIVETPRVEIKKSNTENYQKLNENKFIEPKREPLSTFSIDVDNASYTNARRFIQSGQMPPANSVRIEEFINYFDYDYPQPKNDDPFSINTEISVAPWNKKHKLVHIGIQGKELDYKNLSASNLVFLIDASGSMEEPNKLPLLRSSLKMLLNEMNEKDRISIVAYAGAAGLVLPSTSVKEKTKILNALENVSAGGSTAGGAGIELAYKVAQENFIKDGNNRVILCTDGDFNVGVSSADALVQLIEKKRDNDIFLTICGFGMGNYKDYQMEELSNAGNGNYFYIDNIQEAKKVFVREMRATLFTIAKDVKIQIEFNPTKVAAYRLIGYENRMLKKEDFNDDKKDAGELGAGHTVTALYEIIPVGIESEFLASVDDLRYQNNSKISTNYTTVASSDELLNLKLRYKKPDGKKSKLIVSPLKDENIALSKTSNNFRFSTAVASFGMLLRHSEFKGNSSYQQVMELGESAKGKDEEGYRTEFLKLVESCLLMSK